MPRRNQDSLITYPVRNSSLDTLKLLRFQMTPALHLGSRSQDREPRRHAKGELSFACEHHRASVVGIRLVRFA